MELELYHFALVTVSAVPFQRSKKRLAIESRGRSDYTKQSRFVEGPWLLRGQPDDRRVPSIDLGKLLSLGPLIDRFESAPAAGRLARARAKQVTKARHQLQTVGVWCVVL